MANIWGTIGKKSIKAIGGMTKAEIEAAAEAERAAAQASWDRVAGMEPAREKTGLRYSPAIGPELAGKQYAKDTAKFPGMAGFDPYEPRAIFDAQSASGLPVEIIRNPTRDDLLRMTAPSRDPNSASFRGSMSEALARYMTDDKGNRYAFSASDLVHQEAADALRGHGVPLKSYGGEGMAQDDNGVVRRFGDELTPSGVMSAKDLFRWRYGIPAGIGAATGAAVLGSPQDADAARLPVRLGPEFGKLSMEAFSKPGERDLGRILAGQRQERRPSSIRWAFDENGTPYAWDGNTATHEMMADALGLDWRKSGEAVSAEDALSVLRPRVVGGKDIPVGHQGPWEWAKPGAEKSSWRFYDPRLTPQQNKAIELGRNGFTPEEIIDEMELPTANHLWSILSQAKARGAELPTKKLTGTRRVLNPNSRDANAVPLSKLIDAYNAVGGGRGANAIVADRFGLTPGNVNVRLWKYNSITNKLNELAERGTPKEQIAELAAQELKIPLSEVRRVNDANGEMGRPTFFSAALPFGAAVATGAAALGSPQDADAAGLRFAGDFQPHFIVNPRQEHAAAAPTRSDELNDLISPAFDKLARGDYLGAGFALGQSVPEYLKRRQGDPQAVAADAFELWDPTGLASIPLQWWDQNKYNEDVVRRPDFSSDGGGPEVARYKKRAIFAKGRK